MKIKIPSINGEELYVEDKYSIVLIDTSGSRKTRMSIWIEDNNLELPNHRISTQKSLNMPHMVSLTELGIAEEKFMK